MRYDGFVLVNLQSADHFAEIVARLDDLRRQTDSATAGHFDVVAAIEHGVDPAPYGEAGATWWLAALDWTEVSVGRVRGVIRDGPAASA